MSKLILLYGSYGYTGRLIVHECRRHGVEVILSGRDSRKLAEQSRSSGYPFQVCPLHHTDTLHQLLGRVKAVIHCAGPFAHTAEPMVQACLKTGVHYTDITGEHEVIEKLAQYDDAARRQGIMIMPATGFDVVPTDCLAVFLKSKLPDATHLQLAFTALKGGLSRGTRRTMIAGLGRPGKVRANGVLTDLPLGEGVMEVNFGTFRHTVMCIPWGDIVTAWYSTGIPNVEVFAGTSPKTIAWIKRSRLLYPLFRLRLVKQFLFDWAGRKSGPDSKTLTEGRSYIWGKAWNEHGATAEARLETLNGYLLTAKASVFIARRIIRGDFTPGFQTPAMAYGADLILQAEGSERFEVS